MGAGVTASVIAGAITVTVPGGIADAPADGFDYVRNNNAWTQANYATFGEYRGEFDASIGAFPVAVNQGDWFNTTVAGTVDAQNFAVGDILIATVDAPSTVTFAGNWSIVPNISVTDHTGLTSIGTNTHAQIDTHIANATIHWADAPNDGTRYDRRNNAWIASLVGDVVGPASAVNNFVATYNGATGKLIKDSGIRLSAGSGAGSLEFGDAVTAAGTGTDNLVLGAGATVTGGVGGATLLGANATVSTAFGFACGFNSSVTGGVGMALGYSAASSGGIALGGFCSAVTNGVAMGNFIGANCTGLAVLGSNSGGSSRQIALCANINTTRVGTMVVGGTLGGAITELILGRNYINASAPASVLFGGSGGLGTNNAGSDAVFSAGVGTGNSASRTVRIQTGIPTGSGSTVQARADRVTITDTLTRVLNGARFDGNIGFYNQAPVAQPAGVAVTAAGIHAALVTLGLIT